ncbi:hypothetical protein ACFL6P_09695 [Candidatus Latescibacterota bacterium]
MHVKWILLSYSGRPDTWLQNVDKDFDIGTCDIIAEIVEGNNITNDEIHQHAIFTYKLKDDLKLNRINPIDSSIKNKNIIKVDFNKHLLPNASDSVI